MLEHFESHTLSFPLPIALAEQDQISQAKKKKKVVVVVGRICSRAPLPAAVALSEQYSHAYPMHSYATPVLSAIRPHERLVHTRYASQAVAISRSRLDATPELLVALSALLPR